jgi:DMSO reductase family type II enzyme heme b subunit
VANYVVSLAKTEKIVRPENTVIQAARIAGALPTTPDDVAWDAAPPSTFFMVPQIVGKTRFFTAANDTVSVRALYNENQIALQLEWDDRTKSIPGDDKAASIADEDLTEDAVAVQFPRKIPDGMEKPYFLMGDIAHPVNLWRWSAGTTEKPESIALLDASGIEAQVPRDGGSGDLTAKGSYKDGTWRVVMTRALTTAATDQDLQFVEGRFVPISIFAWDGSNSEAGTHHAMTTWYWLLLKPSAGSKPIIAAIIAVLLVGGILLWWGRSAANRKDGTAP